MRAKRSDSDYRFWMRTGFRTGAWCALERKLSSQINGVPEWCNYASAGTSAEFGQQCWFGTLGADRSAGSEGLFLRIRAAVLVRRQMTPFPLIVSTDRRGVQFPESIKRPNWVGNWLNQHCTLNSSDVPAYVSAGIRRTSTAPRIRHNAVSAGVHMLRSWKPLNKNSVLETRPTWGITGRVTHFRGARETPSTTDW